MFHTLRPHAWAPGVLDFIVVLSFAREKSQIKTVRRSNYNTCKRLNQLGPPMFLVGLFSFINNFRKNRGRTEVIRASDSNHTYAERHLTYGSISVITPNSAQYQSWSFRWQDLDVSLRRRTALWALMLYKSTWDLNNVKYSILLLKLNNCVWHLKGLGDAGSQSGRPYKRCLMRIGT